jgi:hypothetical protein
MQRRIIRPEVNKGSCVVDRYSAKNLTTESFAAIPVLLHLNPYPDGAIEEVRGFFHFLPELHSIGIEPDHRWKVVPESAVHRRSDRK